MKTDTNAVDPDHNHIIKDNAAKVTITPTEAILGHTIGTTADITGVVHADHAQTLIHTILTMTPHIKGHLPTGAHQLTHKIAADHALDQHTAQLRKPHIRIHHIPEDPKVTTHTKRNSRVTIDDPQTDFYSSDDNSSSSEEDSDHLN